MADERIQDLVDQRALNAQTLQFIADREAEIASQADGIAEEHPEMTQAAALEREHRKMLMEAALEEKRLATTIQFAELPHGIIAAAERERRKDLLEIARAEGRLAEELKARGADDPTIGVLAEQAERNRDLLRHVAQTQMEADRQLRDQTP
jgi:hypothetical protein